MALNTRQKKYCRLRAEGKGYEEAYTGAGYGAGTKNKDDRKHNAYNMEHMGNQSAEIKAKIKELQDLADEGAILNRRQKQAWLTQTALNAENDMPDRLRAMDQLNRMTGEYTDTIRTTVNAKVEMTYADRLATMKTDLENNPD